MDDDYTQADHTFRENDAYAAAKYDITLRWLRPARGRQLLNLGCGAGLFNRLAVDSGFSVEACEPDETAYKEASAAAPESVLLHHAGLFDLEPAQVPDVIVMHDVLEHIDNEGEAVDRLAELLPSNGVAVISVPALPRLYGLHDELLGHYRRYTAPGLRVALGRRFEFEHLRYFGASFIPVTYWYSRRRRKPYPVAEASGPGLVGKAFNALCHAESRAAMPVGTSLICMVRPRADSESKTLEVEPS